MKRIITLIAVFYSLAVVYSQGNNKQVQSKTNDIKKSAPTSLPNSLVNLELAGESFGLTSGLGIKTVVGSNNSGFLVGLSSGSESFNSFTYLMPKLGFQYGIYKGLYSNLNLSVPRKNLPTFEYDIYGNLFETRLYTWSLRANISVGYTFSFGNKKRLFINIESSYAFINTDSDYGRLAVFSGLGFRLGTPATTTYEGVKNVTTVPVKP